MPGGFCIVTTRHCHLDCGEARNRSCNRFSSAQEQSGTPTWVIQRRRKSSRPCSGRASPECHRFLRASRHARAPSQTKGSPPLQLARTPGPARLSRWKLDIGANASAPPCPSGRMRRRSRKPKKTEESHERGRGEAWSRRPLKLRSPPPRPPVAPPPPARFVPSEARYQQEVPTSPPSFISKTNFE